MKLDMYTEQSLDPDSTIPLYLVWSYLVCPDESVNEKGIQCVDVLLLFSLLWEGWGLRGRERESGVLVTEAVLGGWLYCTM